MEMHATHTHADGGGPNPHEQVWLQLRTYTYKDACNPHEQVWLQLLAKLRSLGATIVFANFTRVTLATDKVWSNYK